MMRSHSRSSRSPRSVRSKHAFALVVVAAVIQWTGFVGSTALAGPPTTTYQGELLDGGTPANGTYNLVFRLFSLPAGGSEILVNRFEGPNAVTVSGGRFTTILGTGVVLDGTGPGTYTSLAQVFGDFSTAHLQIEVNGVALAQRQPITSAPYALDSGTLGGLAGTQFLRSDVSDNFTGPQLTINAGSIFRVDGGIAVSSGTELTIGGSPALFTIAGANMDLQLGDTSSDEVFLQGTLNMLPDGIADRDQRINFSNNMLFNAESIFWDDSDDRFEFTDEVAFSGPIQVGSTAAVTQVYSAFGTGTPVSAGMNSASDVLITDDLEVLSSIIASGNILMRSGAADGDGIIYFREGGSDTGESFRWDDSEGRFTFSDDVRLGQSANFELTTVASGVTVDNVAEVKSTGGISIRIDTNNNESGPNAGVFAITCNNTTPLLRLQGTDEANLELDNGVVTDAFDFAEAFRAAPGHESLEPGDVVTLAVGTGMREHCEKTDEAHERIILGVVSTNPAFTAGMSFEEIERVDPALTAQRDAAKARGDSAEAVRLEAAMEASMRATWKPIAQIGRVPTKVDGSYGAIKAGDYLTSSPTPGHAMKMTEPGMALGVALEDFDSTGKGTLSVFVRPTWHGAPIEQKRLTALERENAELKGRLDALEAMMQSKFTAR